MGRKKDKIRIRFIGQNAESVTGSCTLIDMNNYNILLECGLFQSNSLKNDYRINNRRLEFKPSEIDYIFINHLHIDHIGLIPRLYANGCRARIIAPKGSKELFKIMCMDSAFIISKDTELLTKKYKMKAEALYTAEDVIESVKYIDEYDFNDTIKLNSSVSFCFVPSGHVINSAQLELWLAEGNRTSKILYTSDLGNVSIPKYYVSKFKPVDHANIVIGECTYADKSRYTKADVREKDLEKIKTIINTTCIDNEHKVLIPIFSFDRAQNILTYLYDLFGQDKNFNIPILIDSPLTIKITDLYPSILEGDDLAKFNTVMQWSNIKYVKEYAESQIWQNKKEPAIILSASGFMNAGRSRTWAKKLLPNSKNHILFVGYSSPNSLSGKIKNNKGNKTISIDGKPIPNRCGITNLTSFTSHMQYDDLLKYYSNINCEKVCLVHSEFASKCEFGKALQNEISRKSKTSKVIIVNKSTNILL